MSRIVCINGEFVPESEARISIFDRGFLMGDSVYEVTAVIHGQLLDFDAHAARLLRSLGELAMPSPLTSNEFKSMHLRLVEENALDEGIVYLQVTRGVAERDFNIPEDAAPGWVAFTQAKNLLDPPQARNGIHVAIVPDMRWGRRDIKTTQLLAACLAKAEARRAGADDAWLMENGFITEGSSNNTFIISRDGALVTRQLSREILSGITRASVLRFASEAGLRIEERHFSPAEAIVAAEAFITSASTFVWPVVGIDGHMLGNGKPGPLTQRLRRIYLDEAFKSLGLARPKSSAVSKI